MSDDPILAALARLETSTAILDKIAAIRTDADTTRAHVLYGLQENLTLSQRISKLEEEMRRR